MVVVPVFEDTLVPGHFRLFIVTAPHQGLPLPHDEKSGLLRVCDRV